MDIFRLWFDNEWNLQLLVHGGALAGALVLVVAVFLFYYVLRNWRLRDFEINEAELGIGKHKIKIRPNREDLQIAFRFWTELKTRKIGLPVDEENDVIVEIYDSWYAFFQIARELIKQIPVSKLRRHESTKEIVRISVEILNQGLRPHLTQWQARYRHWWKTARDQESAAQLSPQELQRQYPEYRALMDDLKKVNGRLMAYCRMLDLLVHS